MLTEQLTTLFKEIEIKEKNNDPIDGLLNQLIKTTLTEFMNELMKCNNKPEVRGLVDRINNTWNLLSKKHSNPLKEDAFVNFVKEDKTFSLLYL